MMTNREAIKILKIERDHMTPTFFVERIEAIDMAISALQAQDLQSTCNQLATDCVSRQAVLDTVKKHYRVDNDLLEVIVYELEYLPSAQPDRSCIDQIKWERDTAIQQLNELGYGFGEAIRHDKDAISRKGAINAVCTVLYPDADKMNDAKKVLKEMPSAQPEYYDYSDIEPLWKSFAEENDTNLTETAKQLKDAMWCGYRKGKADAQSEQRWIPCSETIDIPDHEVLCCDRYGEELIGWLSYVDDQWLCESDGEMMYDPVAWREKPEPYREEGEK